MILGVMTTARLRESISDIFCSLATDDNRQLNSCTTCTDKQPSHRTSYTINSTKNTTKRNTGMANMLKR